MKRVSTSACFWRLMPSVRRRRTAVGEVFFLGGLALLQLIGEEVTAQLQDAFRAWSLEAQLIERRPNERAVVDAVDRDIAAPKSPASFCGRCEGVALPVREERIALGLGSVGRLSDLRVHLEGGWRSLRPRRLHQASREHGLPLPERALPAALAYFSSAISSSASSSGTVPSRMPSTLMMW